jgi:MSHA biogenesis protein MshO
MRRATDFFRFPRADRGFTLVEMIISIVIAGIIVGMVGLFGRRQIDAYLDIGNRAELSDAADTALRRIGRDLQSALPNSVRQSGNFLEYVPIRDAGRYRADVGAGGVGNILDFTSAADTTFDVLGPPVTITAGDQLVIYNTGQVGSDVYAGTSRRAATAGAGLTTVTFAPAGAAFPLASPQKRFQIVGGPVTYECAANAATPELGTINRHWCYSFSAAQPTAFGALTPHAACAAEQVSVLVNNVSACAFSFAPAILQRNGLVVLSLTLTRNGEEVNLLHQVEVLNTP